MKTVHSKKQARRHFIKNGAFSEPVQCAARKTSTKVCATMEEAERYFDYMTGPLPATNEIQQFFHCGLCLKEKPLGVSPREWAQLEVGWTPFGVQIWCRRHECNIAHIDFEGIQHPANFVIHQENVDL
jgi:hypothetical protein